MSERDAAQASRLPPGAMQAGRLRYLDPSQRRQIVLITAAAIAIFIGLRFLPTGTNLNHMDFRVDAKNAIEFCDPLNPQFIPVVAMRSPVTLTVRTEKPAFAGDVVRGTVTLKTANGKAIMPEDLLVAHTRKLHLLVVDSSLTDYYHVHPEPGKNRGEWTFSFQPLLDSVYRVFADFTPAATGRGLYASADLTVANPDGPGKPRDEELVYPAAPHGGTAAGYEFTFTPGAVPLRANRPIDLAFAVVRPDGGPVLLQPVMGSFAHLVAFDRERSGFAHLHPMETDLARPPDPLRPVLHFKVTFPRAGRYVIWAQVHLDKERFVPTAFTVEE